MRTDYLACSFTFHNIFGTFNEFQKVSNNLKQEENIDFVQERTKAIFVVKIKYNLRNQFLSLIIYYIIEVALLSLDSKKLYYEKFFYCCN